MKRMYMNIDFNSVTFPFFEGLADQKKITPEMLYPMIDIYRGTQVTDVMINTFAQVSATKTAHGADYIDLYNENNPVKGIALSANAWRGIYEIQKVHGIDIYETWFDRCRQLGFRPWLSLRMNDCHNPESKEPVSAKDFFFAARKNAWTLGEEYGYYRHCLDYSVKEVRDFMLNYIREQMSRYDVHGIELDFLREYHCFRYLSADMVECREIMVQFIRDVKAILLDCEKIHGHPLELLMRLPRDVEHCMYYGFDIVKMASEGLVDIVNPSPRHSGESGINVDEWRAAIPGVCVVPGIESGIGYVDGKFAVAPHNMVLGIAANYLSYDPDGIYFFNYFISPYMFTRDFTPSNWLEKLWLADETFDRAYATLQCAADCETIYRHPVRFAIISEKFEACAGYPTMWRPIPTEITSEKQTFDIRTGAVPKGKRCALILGFDGGAEDVEVTLNGARITDFEEINIGFIEGIGYQPSGIVSKDTVCYSARFDESLLTSPVQKVLVSSKKSGQVLSWVEINVY